MTLTTERVDADQGFFPESRKSEPLLAPDDDSIELEEEKKSLIIDQDRVQRDSKSNHDAHSIDSHPSAASSEESQLVDVAHSSFLIGRITIFLYAFVTILIAEYFPGNTEVNAAWRGWFLFFLVINVLACIVGMSGVYTHKTKYIFICWVALLVSLMLTGLILLAYIFNPNDGVQLEATMRCEQWMVDETFKSNYTPEQCLEYMKAQLTWTVVGLYVLYVFGAGFGIIIIKQTEDHMRLHKHDMMNETSEVIERQDSLHSEISALSQDENDSDMEYKKNK